MTPTSAPRFTQGLHFTEDRIRLLAREGAGWAEVDSVALAEGDLAAGLARLRDAAGAAPCLLMLPATHVVYRRLPSPFEAPGDLPADPAQRAAQALEGLTVYRPDDLAHDWAALDDGAIALAAVARETLDEAEDFAVANGFAVGGFSALPEGDAFPRQPDFGGPRSPLAGVPDAEAPATGTAPVLPDPTPAPVLSPDPAEGLAESAAPAPVAPAPASPAAPSQAAFTFDAPAPTQPLPPAQDDAAGEDAAASQPEPTLAQVIPLPVAPAPAPPRVAEVVALRGAVGQPGPIAPDHPAPAPQPAATPQDRPTPEVIIDDGIFLRDSNPYRPVRPRNAALGVPQGRARQPGRNLATLALAVAVFLGVAALWAGFLQPQAPDPTPARTPAEAPAAAPQPGLVVPEAGNAASSDRAVVTPEAAAPAPVAGVVPSATPEDAAADVPAPAGPDIPDPAARTPAPDPAQPPAAAPATAPADSSALPPSPAAIPAADALPTTLPAPVAPEQVGRLDASGQIVPTPEGVMTPDGYLLVAGRPENAPPSRPESVIRAAAEAAGIEPQPQELPWPLVAPPVSANPEPMPESEGSDEPGATPRPKRRPGSAAPTPTPTPAPSPAPSPEAPAAEAAPQTATASGPSSPRPRRRPGNLNTSVAPTPPGTDGAVDAALAEAMTADAAAAPGAASPRPKRRPKSLSTAVDAALLEAQVHEQEVQKQAAAAAEAAQAASTAAAQAAEQQARAQAEAQAQTTAQAEAEQQARAAAAAEAAAAAAQLQAQAQAQAQAAATAAAAAQAAAAAKAQAEARAAAKAQAEADARAAAEAAEAERQASAGPTTAHKPRFQHGGASALDGKDIDEPEPVGPAPKGPTPQGVARQATQANALDLGRTTLIGTFGGGKSKRALVRTSSGRITKVKLGDRFDGGTIVQITDGELIYQKGGRLVSLKLLRGS